MNARGVVFVHSSPTAVCPHVEWAISGVLGTKVSLQWAPQGVVPGQMRAECTWTGPVGSGGALAGALRAWPMLRFEVTEEASHGNDGERMSYVPGQGVFRAPTSANGDIMISEQQLRHLAATAGSIEAFRHGVDELLGAAWDADLEVYRHAGDGSPVTWLHQVV